MKESPDKVEILDFATLVDQLAAQQKLPGKKVRAVVRGLVALAAGGLKDGKIVRITGLGSLRIRVGKPDGGTFSSAGRKRVVLSVAKKFKITADAE